VFRFPVGCSGCALLAIVALGCRAGAATSSNSGSGGTSSATGTAATTSTNTGSTGAFMNSSASSGSGMQTAEVFAHSSNTLYKLDPVTKAVATVAAFSGCGTSGVIDIALDKDSNLIATTFDGIYRVDRTSAVCQLIKNGAYPNSLSFIPAGTLDPNVEALVGYDFDQYERIDPTTGNITAVGAPWGNGLGSSGDIVSVKGGGSYLTVSGNNCGDCLAEVDPSGYLYTVEPDQCCAVRKVEPLAEALLSFKAWISGRKRFACASP